MAIFGGLDRARHFDEFADTIETQSGVLTGAQRKATALSNLGVTATVAELALLAGVTAGTHAVSKVLSSDSLGFIDVIKPKLITAGDASLDINGIAAAQGGVVALTGGTSSTSGNAGGAVNLTGGTPGATGVGGAVVLVGAIGGATSGAGGAFSATGGAGTAGNAAGGAVSLIGGLGQGSAAGGAVTITSGAAGATGVAGAVAIAVGGATAGNGSNMTLTGGAGAGGTASGGNVNLVPGAAVSTGTPGEFQVNSNSATMSIPFNYISTLVTQAIWTATRAVRVKAIIGRVRVAGSGGACTLSFYKAGSTVAVGSGTILHSGSYNVAGTADANQTLTLSPTVADVTLAAGDSIGYVLTGTATSAVGNVTIHLTPV